MGTFVVLAGLVSACPAEPGVSSDSEPTATTGTSGPGGSATGTTDGGLTTGASSTGLTTAEATGSSSTEGTSAGTTQGSSTGATTTPVECDADDDCSAAVPECRAVVGCVGGVCVFEDTPQGTPVPEQATGDCHTVVCDGAGGAGPVPDDADVPDDGVPCTLDGCDAGEPFHAPGMTSCYGGPPETAGVGVCKAGVQSCDDKGQPVGPCVGEVTPQDEVCAGGVVDEDCDGVANEGGAGCVCVPGEQVDCYSGPPETESVGACTPGSQTCTDDGLGFGACVGDVLPGIEDCGDLVDVDCDGAIDEDGPSCACGDGIYSAAIEDCDDGNVQDGDGCPADCKHEIAEVRIGYLHMCAVGEDGTLKCWGNNNSGQLGLGDTQARGNDPGEMGDALPFVDLGAGAKVIDVTLGRTHTCALLAGGTVKCWGMGSMLGLGVGGSVGDAPGEMGDALPAVDLGGPVQMLVGYAYHTCALLTGGAMKCWGENTYGELGLGDTQTRGDQPGEMGAALPAVDLGAGKKAVAIGVGYHHTCALLADQTMKCWGRGTEGQLGLGDSKHRGDGPGEMGDALPTVDLAATPAAIAVGENNSCVLVAGGAVKCWGDNVDGSVGNGVYPFVGDGPNEMGGKLAALDLGAGKLAAEIHTGGHTCARLTSGEIKCWGLEIHGQLGHENKTYNHKMGDLLPATKIGQGVIPWKLRLGIVNSCVITTTRRLKCWGDNFGGQLGLGWSAFLEGVGDEPGEMGDKLPYVHVIGP